MERQIAEDPVEKDEKNDPQEHPRMQQKARTPEKKSGKQQQRKQEKIAAQRAGKPVGVCGELAADPSFVPLLLGMGVTEFSMSYTAVSEVKFLLCKTTLEEARKLRDEVMEMTRSRHIISKLRSFHYEKMQPYLPS